VRLFTIGRSEDGRDIVLLAVADEKGHPGAGAAESRDAALADPRRTDAAAGRGYRGERPPPIYYFNAALHSDETGSTESVL